MSGAVAHEAIPVEEHSAWLRGVLETLLRRQRNNRLKPCGHAGATNVALWEPSRVWCRTCFTRNSTLAGADGAVRCDRCDAPSDSVKLPVAVRPGLRVFLRMCAGCLALEGVTAE